MKKILFSAIMVLMLTGLSAQTDEASNVKTGDLVPEFKVKMFDGKEINMKDLRGKVVLINFWAVWCPYCVQELAVVQKEIIDKFKGKDFVFLPISREDTYEKIDAFRKEKGHTFPMGMDPDRSIYNLFAKTSIPRNYVIDKNGKIVYMDKGYNPEMLKELVKNIEKVL